MASIQVCATIPHAKGIKRWGSEHKRMISEIGHKGLNVQLRDLPETPITEVSSRHDADIVASSHTEAALVAQKEGFDAVAMGCLKEPGVTAAREMLDIPVIGEAQASMHMASLKAPTFSFIGPGNCDFPVEWELAKYYGFSEQLISVKHIDIPPSSFSDPKLSLRKKMVSKAKKAIHKDGAKAIIGYGNGKLFRILREKLKVPVVNSVLAGILLAESVARGESNKV